MWKQLAKMLVFVTTVATPLASQTVKDAAVESSIVQVVLRLPNGRLLPQGTAFVVGPDGLVATAFHVYAQAIKAASDARGGDIAVRRVSRNTGKFVWQTVEILAADPKFDTAVFRLRKISADWETVGGLQPLKLSEKNSITPPIPVQAIGYFGSDVYPVHLRCEVVGTGLLTLSSQEVVEELLLSGLLMPGHSGSPVIDSSDGSVVGLVSSIVSASLPFNPSQPQHSGLAKAAKVEHLKKILDSITSK